MKKEYAIQIRKIEDISTISSEIDRVYVGDNFCDRKIPSIQEMSIILEYIKQKNLKLTLLTPYLTNESAKKIKILVDWILKENLEIEIVINDWGMLELLREFEMKLRRKITLVAGVLLSRQKTDPITERLIDKLNPYLQEHFSTPVIVSDVYINFLKNHNINRIELENTNHFFIFDKCMQNNIEISLYYPFVSFATTRMCPLSMYFRRKNMISIQPCNKECKEYYLSLHDDFYGNLIFVGNTIYYKNKKMPGNNNFVSRIVDNDLK